MVIDSGSVGPATLSSPHVLIVGSGPVGLVLAATLEKLGHSALIVESGAQFRDVYAENDLQVACSGTPLPGLIVGRTRQIGGGLNLWGGQLALLEDEDLLRSGAEEVMRWPIGRDALYVGLTEVLDCLDAADVDLINSLKAIQTQDRIIDRYGLKIVQTAWLKDPRLGRKFWSRLRQSQATRLICDLTCIGLRYDANSNRVRGVVATNRAGTRFEIDANATVLAAGTVENARLLLLPTVQEGAAPWHSYDWLGRGFSEHIDANTAQVEIIDRQRLGDIFDPIVSRGIKYSPKIAWAQPQRAQGKGAACGIIFWPQNIRNGISELILVGRALLAQRQLASLVRLPHAVIASGKQVLPLAYRYIAQRRIGSFMDRNAYLRVSVEQPVRRESAVTLSSTDVDRGGSPRAIMNWLRGRDELANLQDFTLGVQRWLEGEGIAKVHIDPALAEGDTAFLANTDDGLHHAGTTRMGLTKQTSVVDTDLRVHNVKNLYACGASVFPSSGYANPTLTAMALASRLAKKLSVELGAARI